MAVAGVVVVRMVQRWEMGGEGEVRKVTGLILAPKGGVAVRLRRV